VTSLFLAVAIGVNPRLVNWLAVIHVAARFLYWILYYAGIGPNNNGPRTAIFGVAFLSGLVLAVAALWRLLI